MKFILILFLFSMVCSVFACDEFSSDQREEAHTFVKTCFAKIREYQKSKLRYFSNHLKDLDNMEFEELNAKQINYRRLNELEEEKNAICDQIEETDVYKNSLREPKEQILLWDSRQEGQARLVQAYMSLTDEWTEYKKNPSDVHAYQALHKRMIAIARIFVATDDKRMFVSGTHLFAEETVEPVNYQADQIFFLALYLLDKELKAERALLPASSSK